MLETDSNQQLGESQYHIYKSGVGDCKISWFYPLSISCPCDPPNNGIVQWQPASYHPGCSALGFPDTRSGHFQHIPPGKLISTMTWIFNAHNPNWFAAQITRGEKSFFINSIVTVQIMIHDSMNSTIIQLKLLLKHEHLHFFTQFDTLQSWLSVMGKYLDLLNS